MQPLNQNLFAAAKTRSDENSSKTAVTNHSILGSERIPTISCPPQQATKAFPKVAKVDADPTAPSTVPRPFPKVLPAPAPLVKKVVKQEPQLFAAAEKR